MALLALLVAAPVAAQLPAPVPDTPTPLVPVHADRMLGRAEREVHAALLAGGDDRARNAHLDAAEEVARHVAEEDPTSADAWYWLAVAGGIRTEHGGPLEKLTTGRQVFFTTARVLELDPDHPGGHELMGRLHAAVMRLPGIVRVMALRMGLGDALGEASWAHAEEHYLRAAELDPVALAPRLELGKLYVEQEREGDALRILRSARDLPAPTEVDRRLRVEVRDLLGRLEATAAPPEGPGPGGPVSAGGPSAHR